MTTLALQGQRLFGSATKKIIAHEAICTPIRFGAFFFVKESLPVELFVAALIGYGFSVWENRKSDKPFSPDMKMLGIQMALSYATLGLHMSATHSGGYLHDNVFAPLGSAVKDVLSL